MISKNNTKVGKQMVKTFKYIKVIFKNKDVGVFIIIHPISGGATAPFIMAVNEEGEIIGGIGANGITITNYNGGGGSGGYTVYSYLGTQSEYCYGDCPEGYIEVFPTESEE
ncbi:MAG: hypothetical protein ACI9IA_000592 [Enterobacterales bacterium]